MNDDLDLDINNYNMHDLEQFFQIKPSQKYTAADIEEKEVKIREVLLSSGKVDRKFKKDLLDFLETARNWIIFVKCGGPKQPTTIPKNHRLDNTIYKEQSIPRNDELVTPNNKPFVYAQNSDFFRGSLLPLGN